MKREGYIVDCAFDGEEAKEYIRVYDYDLIISDIMMPEIDGYELLKFIRDRENDVPVLFLTAKDAIEDKVKGLDLGADDYLVKPFEVDELFARIRVLLRRKYGKRDNYISIGSVKVDIGKKVVYKGDMIVNLTAKEYSILEYLLINKGVLISKERLIENIWGIDYEGNSNVIEVLIKNIRKKLDDDGDSIITTKRGMGYVINERD